MTKRMLIDATHEEETRVAIMEGKRLLEFDYESKYRKALKGSIFLAKVTRVEPSLQAAFVNFGGNRHGFLPFSEIHPDYFRIPIADREALLAEQEAALAAQEEREQEEDRPEEEAPAAEASTEIVEDGEDRSVIEEIGGGQEGVAEASESPVTEEEAGAPDTAEDHQAESEDSAPADSESKDEAPENENSDHRRGGRHRRGRGRRGRHRAFKSRQVESFGGEQYEDGDSRFRFSLRRKYKIQEVIKRGQIMLVQVSKEERGNKGAAVSTYLSLPGRYCVLMPNSPRGGGVSRKIASYKDRAAMRDMLKDLEVPKGMSVIVRTAGVSRTKPEIKRDLDYLMKLWDNIRELTLQSSAPALVYEEADLIKRAVRDLYARDVDEIIVAGEEGFKNARNFMKMMIPSHVKRVVEYSGNESVPLFVRHQAEAQIAEIGEPRMNLPSGGYLVINPTEALVSIDVNSGKATKERHIEETALKTNLEAAEEVARQLRLRDLGGLVVIDFIDMEDRRNNAKVERKMRDALSTDRARIQMGRISSFGLMELSRQRLNPSLTESQFEVCSHCLGVGRTRTADATSIMVLRAIEDEGIKGRASQLIAYVSDAVALYILNYKRQNLSAIESRYNLSVQVRVDESIGAGYRVEVSRPNNANAQPEEGGGGQGSREESESGEQDSRQHGGHHHHHGGGDQRPGGRRRGRRGGRRRRGGGGGGSGGGDNRGRNAESRSFADDMNTEGTDDHSAPEESFDHSTEAEAAESFVREESVQAAPPPSNDARPARAPRDAAPREYEKINEVPDEKKRGWWNRLVE